MATVLILAFFSLVVRCFSYVDFLDPFSFHYVIVGAGTSGSVVASRLSEDPDVEVLLVEAGGEPFPEAEIPYISYKTLKTEMNWDFVTIKQKWCCNVFENNEVPITSGKSLGGSSSVNFMTYVKPNKFDFDQWIQNGGQNGSKNGVQDGDWSYAKILPYLNKLENYQIPHTSRDSPYHNVDGPFTVTEPDTKSIASDVFLLAGLENGYPVTDYNGENRYGFSFPSVTMKYGKRLGTYETYVKPHLRRPNLHVTLNSYVIKINFDANLTAIGVTYEKNGRDVTVSAKTEVILCAGAVNSPKILMLSGIGPKKTLEEFGISVLVDSSGVGYNLHDHVTVYGETYRVNQSITLKPSQYETETNLRLWQTSRTGPMTNPMGFEGIAYLNSPLNFRRESPDIQIKMNSARIYEIYRDRLKKFWKYVSPSPFQDVVTFYPTLLRPKSRGRITLGSGDPYRPPLIDPNYLSHPDDVATLASAIEITHRIAKSRAFRMYGSTLYTLTNPRCARKTFFRSAYFRCLAESMATSGHALAGTCKMGDVDDKMAVVDYKLKVLGAKKLRVADASVMPTLVSAEPEVTCAMIGERAAAMIKTERKSEEQRDELETSETDYCV